TTHRNRHRTPDIRCYPYRDTSLVWPRSTRESPRCVRPWVGGYPHCRASPDPGTYTEGSTLTTGSRGLPRRAHPPPAPRVPTQGRTRRTVHLPTRPHLHGSRG